MNGIFVVYQYWGGYLFQKTPPDSNLSGMIIDQKDKQGSENYTAGDIFRWGKKQIEPYRTVEQASVWHWRSPAKTRLDKWSQHPYHWLLTYPLKLHRVASSPLSCTLFLTLLYSLSTIGDLLSAGAATHASIGLCKNYVMSLMRLLNITASPDCIFHLKATFLSHPLLCFHCHPRTPRWV